MQVYVRGWKAQSLGLAVGTSAGTVVIVEVGRRRVCHPKKEAMSLRCGKVRLPMSARGGL